ncbi:hypothetical protein [Herbaspirillum huttiense]|uniref:hypothetical protein n=1 Tax=Herbaspirillum huttiense TaxID=863372 RepID=UPI003B3B254E
MSAATLIDNVIDRPGLKNDAALARELWTYATVISKIRNNRIPVGPLMILRIHEATGWPTRQIKAVIAGEGA